MLKNNQSGDKDRSRTEIEANDSLNELSDSLENLAIQHKDQSGRGDSSKLLKRGPTGGIPNVSSGYCHLNILDGQGSCPQQGIPVTADNRRKLEESDEQPSKFQRLGVSQLMLTPGVKQQVQSPRVSQSDMWLSGVQQQSQPCLSNQRPGATPQGTWFPVVNGQNPTSSVNVSMADTRPGNFFNYTPQFCSKSRSDFTYIQSTGHQFAQVTSQSKATASQPMPSNTAMIFNRQPNYTGCSADMSIQEMPFDLFSDNTDGSQGIITDMILDLFTEQENQPKLSKIEGESRNDTKHQSDASDGGSDSVAGSTHDKRSPSPGHCLGVKQPLTPAVNFFDNAQKEKQINELKDTNISEDQTNSSVENTSIGSAVEVFDGLDFSRDPDVLDSENMADLFKHANQDTSSSVMQLCFQPAINSFHNMNVHSPAPATQIMPQLTQYLQQNSCVPQQDVSNATLPPTLQNTHEPYVLYPDTNGPANSFQVTHSRIVLSDNSTTQTSPSTAATSVRPVCSTTSRTETNSWLAAVDRPVIDPSNKQNTLSCDQLFISTPLQQPNHSAWSEETFTATKVRVIQNIATVSAAAPNTFQPQVLQSSLQHQLPQQGPLSSALSTKRAFAPTGSAVTASVGFRQNVPFMNLSAHPTDHALGPLALPLNNNLAATKVPSNGALLDPVADSFVQTFIPNSATLSGKGPDFTQNNTKASTFAVPHCSPLTSPAAAGLRPNVPPDITSTSPAFGLSLTVPQSRALTHPLAVGCSPNVPPGNRFAAPLIAPQNNTVATLAGCCGQIISVNSTSATGCLHGASPDNTSTSPAFVQHVLPDQSGLAAGLNPSDNAFSSVGFAFGPQNNNLASTAFIELNPQNSMSASAGFETGLCQNRAFTSQAKTRFNIPPAVVSTLSNCAPLQSSTAAAVFQGAPMTVFVLPVNFPQTAMTQLSGQPPKKQSSKYVPIAPKRTGPNVSDGEYISCGAVCNLTSQNRSEQKSKNPSQQKTQDTYQRLLKEASQTIADIAPAVLLKEDEEGDTYLHIAACQQPCHVVHALLQRLRQIGPKSLIDRGNKKGQTPLYLATSKNRAKNVQLLVKCGASPNLFAESVDSDGNVERKTALHVAALQGSDYNKTLMELIKARDIDLNILNSNGLTALHLAVIKHGTLRKNGQDNLDSTGRSGTNGQDTLDSTGRSEKNGQDKQDSTARPGENGQDKLDSTARPGKNGQDKLDSTAIVQTLIRSGANPNIQDLRGKTALMYAVQKKKEDMVKTILRSVGPSQVRTVIEARDSSGKTSLQIADALKGSSGVDMWTCINNFHQEALEGKLN